MMKKNSVKPINSFKEIHIPKPCHEKWEDMKVVEQNRFCSKCKEVVYDFTEGDLDTFNRLRQEKNGSFCVRIYKEDINQNLKYERITVRNLWSSSLKRLHYLAAIVVMKLSFVQMANGQTKLQSKAGSFGNSLNLILPDPEQKRIEKANVSIRGTVVDKETKYFIKNATVKVVDEKGRLISETITADSGKFYIPLSDTLNLNQKFTIQAEKGRFKTRFNVTKYSRDEKEISESDFDKVELELKSHKRHRSSGFLGLGRKRYVVAGRYY